MPGREQSRSELKKRALADLEHARLSLALHSEEASLELSPASIVERSFKKHRAAWIVGATVAGAALLRLVLSGSSKNERDISGKSGTKKASVIGMLSVPLIAMGRKAAFEYATRYFKNHFKQSFQASAREQDPI